MLSKLLSKNIGFEIDFSKFDSVAPDNCAYCGELGATIKYQNIIGGNFPNKDLMQTNKPFCQDCAGMLKDTRFSKNSWLLSGDKFEFLNYKEDKGVIIKLLFDYIEPPYYIAVKKNPLKQKHLVFGAVQWNNTERTIVIDGVEVKYNIEKYKKIFELIDVLYNELLQPKKCILSGEYQTGKMDQNVFEKLLEIEKKINNVRHEMSFKFFVDMITKKEAQPCLQQEQMKQVQTEKVKSESGQLNFLV